MCWALLGSSTFKIAMAVEPDEVVVLLAGSTFLFFLGVTIYLRYVRECGGSAKSGIGMASGRSGKLSSSVNVIVHGLGK